MATTKKTPGKLGDMVTYVSTKGYEKAAMVVGTPESILPGHKYPTLAEGERHLTIFTLDGISTRLNVPDNITPEDATEGKTVGFWRV